MDVTDYTVDKYRFYHTDNKVIAVSTYAGLPVRGVAKCDPEDTFSLESGKALAAARCNEKIAEKRCKRAMRKFFEAHKAAVEAQEYFERMREYFDDSIDNLKTASDYVDDVLNDIAP